MILDAAPRHLLARRRSLAGREVVYETPDGLDVETSDQYEILSRRVLWDDVQLVTYHREVGASFVVFNLMGGAIMGIGFWPALFAGLEWYWALLFFIPGLPFFIAAGARLLLRQEIITVFGRRSKAVIRYTYRKQTAKQTYGHICAKTRQAQREVEAALKAEEEASAPPPLEIEMPPAEAREGEVGQ